MLEISLFKFFPLVVVEPEAHRRSCYAGHRS